MRELKWAYQYILKRWWWYLAGFAAMAVQGVASVWNVALQGEIIDRVFLDGQYDRFWRLLFFMLLAVVICYGFHVAVGMTFHFNGYGAREDMGKDLMEHLYQIREAEFRKKRTGKLTNCFLYDIERVCEDVAYQGIPRVFQAGVNVLLLSAAIFRISWQLFCATGVLAVLYVFCVQYFSKPVEEAAKTTQRARGELSVVVDEGIASAKDVIAYHKTGWQFGRFSEVFRKYLQCALFESKKLNVSLAAAEGIRWGMNLVVLAVGGMSVLKNTMSLGSLVIVYQYAGSLCEWAQMAYERSMRIFTVVGSAERLMAELEEEKEQFGECEAVYHDGEENAVCFENVRFFYEEENPVLDGISFQIPKGSTVAFVGASGSGKSTIARLLLRLNTTYTGKISVCGHSLMEISEDSWRRLVGAVFQEPYLFPDSIRMNLEFGGSFTEEQLIQVCDCVKLQSLIQSLPNGLDTQVGERGISFSGGQRQRLAIARSLLRNPDILIMDEATSALDLETEYEIKKMLDKERQGKTTILIAHRLSTVVNADCIYVLDQGKIVGKGTHKELMENCPVYQNMENVASR